MSKDPSTVNDEFGADLPLPPAGDRLRLPEAAHEPLRALAEFVATATTVADDIDRPVAEHSKKLRAMEAALADGDPGLMDGPCATARRLGAVLAESGIIDQAARRLLQGQQKWIESGRFHTWNDLLLYCRFAASPIAHLVLDVMNEPDLEARPRAEALAAAIRILVGLRDAAADYATHGRMIIPEDWFREAALSPDRLRGGSAEGQTRAIFDRTLDGIDHLLTEAAELPSTIKEPALRGLVAETLLLATKLAGRLRHQDPLSERVTLTARDRFVCRWRTRLAWVSPSRSPRNAS